MRRDEVIEANVLIVQRRLRITSTVRTEVFSSVKRIGHAPEPAEPTPPPETAP